MRPLAPLSRFLAGVDDERLLEDGADLVARIERAIRVLENHLHHAAQALALLAELLSLPGGDRREARRILDKLFADPNTESLPAPARAEALILRASLQTNDEKAKADYDAAVALTPSDPDVLLARADFYRQQKEYEKALADVAAILAKDPESPTAYILRSQIQRSQEKWADALASLAKAAELAPAAVTPLQARGEIRRQQDDYAGAIEDFTKVLELQPGNLMALVHRAEAYLASDQFDLALVDAELALKAEPGLVVGHAMRAQILASQQRLPEAIAEMEKLAAAIPQQTEYKMQLALYYLVANESRKAIKAYSEVIAAEADNFGALRSRGDAYLNIGDHAAAIADFGKALPLRPDDTSLLNNYAWVLATSPEDGVRDGKRAIELATKACELTEFKKPHILSTLAAAYAESGDFETARKWSKQAVATRDEDDDQEHAKEMAEQLSKELASYEANKPWRERMAAKESSAGESEDSPTTAAPADSPPPAEAKSPEPTAQSAAQPGSR